MKKPSLPATILMTADTIGGVWTYALELTRALQEYNVEVYLATMGRRLSTSQWKAADNISNLVVKESEYALEWMDGPWDAVDEAGAWLLELERQIKPDLIHLNNYAHGNLSWKAPVLTVGHSCVLSWWQAVKKEQAPDTFNIYAARVKEGLQQSDRVIGVSRHMLDCLKQHYGPFTTSGFIYNGRDKKGFYSSAKRPVIFSMGRIWDEAKNISALEVISGHVPWPVYIAGEDYGHLMPRADNLYPLGKLYSAEVAKWLSTSAIYVMPARYEPFGLSVLEAALSGCAVIVGDIPSLREIWADAALYADPSDPGDLKYQIETLIKDDDKRKLMAGKALQRAQRYSIDAFAGKYAGYYRQLLQGEQNKLASGVA
ncbi:MAG: glycosyltransferase family 4 protein [Balneolales bacterium]